MVVVVVVEELHHFLVVVVYHVWMNGREQNDQSHVNDGHSRDDQNHDDQNRDDHGGHGGDQNDQRHTTEYPNVYHDSCYMVQSYDLKYHQQMDLNKKLLGYCNKHPSI